MKRSGVKLCPLKVIGINQCCRIALFLKCNNEMSLVAFYGCNMGFLHMSAIVFGSSCNNTFVIESSSVTFKFRGITFFWSHSDEFLVLELCEMQGIHAWFTRCVKIERWSKTLSYTVPSCYLTFNIVVHNLWHVLRGNRRR